MLIKQISVFLENKMGRLADILKILADKSIDISALSIADTTDFGILRLIVSEPQKAEKVLKEADVTVKCTEVIAIGVVDKPGGLASAVSMLKENGVNIEYTYAFLGKSTDGYAMVILRVDDPEKGISVLRKHPEIKVLDPDKVYNQ